MQEKEYTVKRKDECYNIYEKERKNFNNVERMEYSEEKDICIISYKTQIDRRTGKSCQGYNLFEQIADCTTEIITQEF